MTLVLLQHPEVVALLLVSTVLLFAYAVSGKEKPALAVGAGLSIAAMCVAALCCSVPYEELLALLVVLMLLCYLFFPKACK